MHQSGRFEVSLGDTVLCHKEPCNTLAMVLDVIVIVKKNWNKRQMVLSMAE